MTYDDIEGGGARCRHRHHRHHRHDRHHDCGPRGALRRMRESARRRGRLSRDTDEGMLFGVCAGIARHLGLRPRTVRIATLVLLVFFTAPTLIAYALIAWLAPARRDGEAGGRYGGDADHDHDPAPADDGGSGGAVEGLARLKNRFRRLEERFADMEAQVTGSAAPDRQ